MTCTYNGLEDAPIVLESRIQRSGELPCRIAIEVSMFRWARREKTGVERICRPAAGPVPWYAVKARVEEVKSIVDGR